MAEHARQILVDAFGRVRELVIDLTDNLNDEIATYRPDPEANSIAWLIWHLTRGQDHQVADLAHVEQVWPQWRERFGLPFDKWATGYGQGPKEVAAVRVSGDLLGEYHRDVHELTLRYLDGLTAQELDRIVDTRWDPPVTAAVRLVSVIGDTMQHAGQAAYVHPLLCAASRSDVTRLGISRVLPTASVEGWRCQRAHSSSRPRRISTPLFKMTFSSYSDRRLAVWRE
jgi:uncharacterized damage-inducible protein DinB